MNATKRIFDIALAGFLILLLSPLALWLYIRLWTSQGWPVFYWSERMSGLNRSFSLLKFRTMTVVASDQGVSGGHKSNRLTPMGSRLRRLRLDEIPQLWNVLKGDMSFVGPRPPLREYVEKFPHIYSEVLKSRPGITGLATLRFHRHEERILARATTAAETEALYTRICIPRKARFDLIYQRHASFCLDAKLLARTIQVVFRKQHSPDRRKTDHV